MGRLKREAEEREAIALEAAEVLRRRNMTDEERLDEDRKLGRVPGNTTHTYIHTYIHAFMHTYIHLLTS